MLVFEMCVLQAVCAHVCLSLQMCVFVSQALYVQKAIDVVLRCD